MKLGIFALTAAALACSLLAATKVSAQDTVIVRETVRRTLSPSEEANLMGRLEFAREADAGNSQSWDDNSGKASAYARKAREVESVMRQIDMGVPVSEPQIAHALDNSSAEKY